MTLNITNEECELIKQHRKDLKRVVKLAKKQSRCEHDFVYINYVHGEQYYVCSKCKLSEFR